MTKITYNTDGGWITLRAVGHAGSGPVQTGGNIICAGISSLTQCLGIYAITHKGKEVKSSGRIDIEMPDTLESRAVFAAVYTTLQKFAMDYPQEVEAQAFAATRRGEK